VAAAGSPIASVDDLHRLLAGPAAIGHPVTLAIVRGRERLSPEVTPVESP
jgi:S1-C subfamily serine protease